ncbi:MAG: aminodeoxychorismate synthase component I [Chloroflexi bacterium]|nr:aminodeoxychorismate synthase component I [Chloroflexota bacterium]
MITPLVLETWPDPEPPVEMFDRLPHEPFRFLLESQGGPGDIARWSFLSHRPFLRFQSRGRVLTLWDDKGTRQWEGDPLEAMETLLAQHAVAASPGSPPFTGGAVGYFSYDLGRQIERLPDTAHDDLQLPEIHLAFYDHLIAIDHHQQSGALIALPLPGRETKAIEAAQELIQFLRNSPPSPELAFRVQERRVRSNFTRPQYCQSVERALERIGAGHIYQVNLSQRFTAPLNSSAESLYRILRANNPAPFAAFLDLGDFQIVSASPERFLFVAPLARRVETRPIKGTRPRGKTPGDDERLKAELIASEKDAAELVMIVDLERNDLGRVCEFGSVRVPDLRRVEAYPTVWHTVATVEGRLRPNVTRADLLRATFPGGSITGAPKIRAMQIIEELEGLRRHVYCGSIGYLGFDGTLDLNIAIRTLTLVNGQAYFHAGGGIVADSQPEDEYEETLHKAQALANALGFDVRQISS